MGKMICGTWGSRFLRFFSGIFFRVVIGLLMIMLQPLSAHAVEVTAQVQHSAKQFIHQQINQWAAQGAIKQYKTDINLRLPEVLNRFATCPKPVEISYASRLSNLWGMISLKAECPAQFWQTRLQARVEVRARVPVLNHSMGRGEVISGKDIAWRWQRLLPSSDDFVTKTDEVIGLQVERHIRAGQVINRRQIGLADWVTSGQQVVIEAASDRFVVRMQGQALENAGKGRSVRVRNISSGKVILAYPIAPGVVETRF